MKPLLVVGAGGHAASCVDVVSASDEFEVRGLIDPAFAAGSARLGSVVLGSDEVLSKLRQECDSALVAIGQIKSSAARRRVAAILQALDFRFPVVTARSARVAARASIGKGGIVMHGTTIGPEVEIGTMSIINNHALIEHGSQVGDYVHVSTGAVINGECSIGDDCFLGSRSVVLQGVRIGSRCIVPAGAIVRRDMSSDSIYKD